MPIRLFGDLVRSLGLITALLAVPTADAFVVASWTGVLRDTAGRPIAEATVRLRSRSGDHGYTAPTSASGNFPFTGIVSPAYKLSLETPGNPCYPPNHS